MTIDPMYIPSMPGVGPAGSSNSIEFADKIDLQTLSSGLLYWQHEGRDMMKNLVAAFNNLAEIYRNSTTETIKYRTSRLRKNDFVEKDLEVLYPYTAKGQQEFETNIMVLEDAAGLIYELLVDLYQRLYKLRPEEESGREDVKPIPSHLQQPGGPTEIIHTSPDQPHWWDKFNIMSSNKSNYALDDVLSPYRRTGRILRELENTTNVEERLNSYHEFAVVDVALGFGPEIQLSRMRIESSFLKSWVRPKILKMVKAATILMMKEEQIKQQSVVTKSYEEKERHRPPDWMPQPG